MQFLQHWQISAISHVSRSANLLIQHDEHFWMQCVEAQPGMGAVRLSCERIHEQH